MKCFSLRPFVLCGFDAILQPGFSQSIQTSRIDQCLETALQKNISAQLSDPLNFIFPAFGLRLPAQTVNIPGGTAVVNIPAKAFGPGFRPSTIQMPVSFPGQTLGKPAQTYVIRQQNVKVLDQDLAMGA